MVMLQPPSDSQRLEIISVGDFFRQINWSGGTLPHLNDDVAIEDTPYETVGQFFSTFPWRGAVASIPSEDWEAVSDNEVDDPMDRDTLTLEDLSALF
ncbi:MAG: hypothetical protein KTR27_01190 [Leptolyngbyaceae cyanobacterium MAG.088]|nr:hypothetical protein [Leptolyngbyaceae cyanobacterium MAG.088]